MYKPGGVHRGILQKNLVNFFYLRVITKLNILQTVILKESNPSEIEDRIIQFNLC